MGMLGLDTSGGSTEEEALQALVPELQDRHGRSVTRNVSGCNRLTAASSGPDSLFFPAQNHDSRYCEIATAAPLLRNDRAGDLVTVEDCVPMDDSDERGS